MRTAGAFPGAGKERVPAQKGLTLPAEILTPQEVLAILHECKDTTTGIRDRALITVMYRSGLRVSEALSLEPKDVDLHICAIAVLHGKGDRRRTVGIDPGASLVVEHWVEVRRQWLASPLGVPLFCSQKCRRMSKPMVREMLVRNARRVGIEKRVHPHGLRHTMAYELLMKGVVLHSGSLMSCVATHQERPWRSRLLPSRCSRSCPVGTGLRLSDTYAVDPTLRGRQAHDGPVDTSLSFEGESGLLLLGRLVPSHRPAVLPVPRWVDVPSLQPQLECLGNDNRPRPMRWRCHIDEGNQFSRKRNVDLAKVRLGHALNVSHQRARFKRSVACGATQQWRHRYP
jgi:hypothetical protein